MLLRVFFWLCGLELEVRFPLLEAGLLLTVGTSNSNGTNKSFLVYFKHRFETTSALHCIDHI
jgi:hypothetical protein